MSKALNFLKKQAVPVISFLLAAASVFLIKPDKEYLSYIDYRTLSLLFCLMAVMAGFKKTGVFSLAAGSLIKKCSSMRLLTLVLTMLCFFTSMVITNDVALITFVPLTVSALALSGKTEKLIVITVLETVAANLGSMLTPIGNPQNLYLFSRFNMTAGELFMSVLPYGALALLLTVGCSMLVKGRADCTAGEEKPASPRAAALGVYSVLFLLSLLTVFRVVPYYVTFAATLIVLLIFDRRVLLGVDYSLLLTFAFLFVFIGNLGRVGAVSDFLAGVCRGREVLCGIAASQVISNVPAALLLSGFTDNAPALLVGVDLGGLGTLIASMASLISFRFVSKEDVSAGRYIAVFTGVNVIFLAAEAALYLVIR